MIQHPPVYQELRHLESYKMVIKLGPAGSAPQTSSNMVQKAAKGLPGLPRKNLIKLGALFTNNNIQKVRRIHSMTLPMEFRKLFP